MKNLFHDKTIILGAIGLVLIIFFLIFIGILPGKKESGPPAASINIWTVDDDERLWQTIISDFRKEYQDIDVSHQRFEGANYEETLVNRLAEGRGPDIFVLKNTWLEKHQDKIYPLPQMALQFSAIDFQKRFVEAASDDLIALDGQILGLPLYLDTLALFYNKDAFNAAGIASPPETWDDLLLISRRFSEKTRSGDIIKSGIALGTAQNIENFFEILSALFLQNGDLIASRNQQQQIILSERATQALRFYVSFADPSGQNFSWTSRLPDSFEALANEKTMMAIGFANDIKKIKAKNPHLNLGVALLPQPKDVRVPLTYGSYYFPTVSRLSRAPDAAWRFLLFVATSDSTQKYLETNNLAPARRDLIAFGAPNLVMDIFYRQALIAKTWPIFNESASKNLFKESIEALISKAVTPDQAIQRMIDRLGRLLQ